MDCPTCGAAIPQGATECPSCALDRGAEAARSGPQIDRVSQSTVDEEYVRWEGLPWAPLGTFSQTKDQFRKSLALSAAITAVVAAVFVAIGLWVCGVLLPLAATIAAWYAWWLGRANTE